jgi:cellobiose phosphorylase
MFCGEEGDLEAPVSVFKNILPFKDNIQGREAMGALRFKSITLAPARSHSYIILMGISEDRLPVKSIMHRFNSLDKVRDALEETKDFWLSKSEELSPSRDNSDKNLLVDTKCQGVDESWGENQNKNSSKTHFNNWFRWVSIQPTLRKIFGCSFLPDFDYGKGGRGWRDLWQDALILILANPKQGRDLLLNNFSGVRIDGSNATIIGKQPGEFLADRNALPRVWMDHGVWPLLTTDFYIDKTDDAEILFEKTGYFSDQYVWRSRKINPNFKPCKYKGTVLEHLILQNLTQFFNVGAHNHIRLEGADWNDGLDMASEFGESVAFSCVYASNLKKLAQLLRNSGKREISLFAEIRTLLKFCDYNNIKAKQEQLGEYFKQVEDGISGKVISVNCDQFIKDLESKADWTFEHIRKKEWIPEGFFNGYYDNKKERVEGIKGNLVRMSLTSQVFPIMSGVATESQIKEILKNVRKYLFDKELKGYHLNTDFGEEQHDLGRALSFVYGDKENGAFFNHMIALFAYALCSRGFVNEGREVLSSIYNMAIRTERSKIYPCVPEYFDSQGKGMYAYLTGSASWFVLVHLAKF